MFHFPAFPPHTLYIQMRVTPLIIRVPGYPIRTSSDHSSVDNSPRPIAVSHVLHRLLMPRHPPCALTHFTTTRCSHPLCNTQQTTTPPPPQPPPPTHPTPEPHTLVTSQNQPAGVRKPVTEDGQRTTPTHAGVPSGPNSMPSPLPPHTPTGQQPTGTHNDTGLSVFHPAIPHPTHHPPRRHTGLRPETIQ